MAAILHDDLAPVEGIPESLRVLLERCLRKDPARRAQSMADIKLVLEDMREAREAGGARTERRGKWLWIATAMVLAAVALAGWLRTPRRTERSWMLSLGAITDAVLSPDGSSAISRHSHGLFLRRFDSPAEIPLYTGRPLRDVPTWSPDSSQVLFNTLEGLSRCEYPTVRRPSFGRILPIHAEPLGGRTATF